MNSFDKQEISRRVDLLKSYITEYAEENGEYLCGDMFAWLYDNMDFEDHWIISKYLDGWYIDSEEARDMLLDDKEDAEEHGRTDTDDYTDICDALDLLEEDTLIEYNVVENHQMPQQITRREICDFLDVSKED